MLTCSLEVEIAAIALAMERAAHYYSFTTMKKEHEELFILSDSKSAINRTSAGYRPSCTPFGNIAASVFLKGQC